MDTASTKPVLERTTKAKKLVLGTLAGLKNLITGCRNFFSSGLKQYQLWVDKRNKSTSAQNETSKQTQGPEPE